jgi:hypothetical protein
MKIILSILFIVNYTLLIGQDTVRYIGNTLSNVDYHHGQLQPAVGVHNIQTMRSNRADNNATTSWTYNHQPMLAYWDNTFYVEYLNNPVGEHIPPGQTLLQTSSDGYNWNAPVVIFPPYKIPDGFVKEGKKDTAKNNFAVMHQRIGFYTSKSKQLFALAYYGIVLGAKDDPNDGNGIGRVIREIKKDGSFGPIYFLRYNHLFNEKNTAYPFYKNAKDKALIKACDEILATPLLMMQTVEEADRNDPLIPLKKDYKAFNYYHLLNGKVVGWWKNALTSVSNDEGKTWQYNPTRAPGFVNANAKIWGQKTSDGKFATVYNPSEFRWPLALSVSDDGLNYKNLLLVNGDISTMRYGGAYKSYGPQYVRGIQEMDGTPPNNNMWVTYSMNKEDIWVAKIPVPIISAVKERVEDDFQNSNTALTSFIQWNIYSPALCKVQLANSGLFLNDADPFDYAKAERIFPKAEQVKLQFYITAKQNDFGNAEIELVNETGLACLRIILDSTGNILTKQGYRNKTIGKYYANQQLSVVLDVNVKTRFYSIQINNENPSTNLCFAPVANVNRIVFRTGTTRRFPNADTPTDQDYDVKNVDSKVQNAQYIIHSLTTQKIK